MAMQFCSLDDAFQEMGMAPSPGCGQEDGNAAKAARKEERRKARRCRGPPAGYLDLSKDPDRQHVTKLPDVPAMNPATGVREYQGVAEAFESGAGAATEDTYMNADHNKWLHSKDQPKYPSTTDDSSYDRDPMNAFLKSEEREHVMVVPVSGTQTAMKKRFFGASGPDEEFFADYQPDQKDYKLQPDFMKAFEESGAARAGAIAAGLPTPSVNQYWKPLTPAGAQTSFVEHLPPPGGEQVVPRGSRLREDPDMKEVMRRMDTIFARLDDMNQASPEQVTSELLMFISSGVFVLFVMDLLVKKGSRMRF